MNIQQLLSNSAAKNPAGVAIRYKENGGWEEMDYETLHKNAKCVSEALHNLKIKPGEKVGIHMENCFRWPEIYFGIAGAGFTAVPIDPKLGENEIAHVVRHSECRVLFATAKTYHLIREIVEDLPNLKSVILTDKQSVRPAENRKVKFLGYTAVLREAQENALGEKSFYIQNEPDQDDVASIIYTSGTTGRQKGAMLTHRNFCSNVESCARTIEVGPADNFLLVLPLHHVFAFTTNLLLPIAVGAEISLVENLRTVGENIREVSPTALIAVPLLLEKVYNKTMRGLKQKRAAYAMFRMGIKAPVAKGIKKNMGGKLRLVISGGAPASVDVLQGFMELGIPILEGYGLTETAPVLTLNPPDASHPGTVGRPLPGVEIEIADQNKRGVGEIAARGDNVMKGYFRDPEATEAVFRDDLFLTGDLGFRDKDGYITITGRKKSLIVNREGKNIYPEEVEACINRSELVLESLVLAVKTPNEAGERVGVIVVPDYEAIDQKHKHSRKTLSFSEVEALMREEIKRETSHLAQFKRPRKIQVRMEEFEKTSTKKIKRYLYELNGIEV